MQAHLDIRAQILVGQSSGNPGVSVPRAKTMTRNASVCDKREAVRHQAVKRNGTAIPSQRLSAFRLKEEENSDITNATSHKAGSR
jgi:hypothetical protein